MSPLATTTTVALLAVAVAVSALPSTERAIAQRAARKQQAAPERSMKDATSVVRPTSTAKVVPRSFSADSRRHQARKKRHRRSLFRRVKRQNENQGYYPDDEAAQYRPNARNDPLARWDTSAQLVDQQDNLPAEDPYGPYPAMLRNEDSSARDPAQQPAYGTWGEQDPRVGVSNVEESAAYDYAGAPRQEKRDAVPGNADEKRVDSWSQYDPPAWKERRRSSEQYRKRRDYGASRNSDAQQRPYPRRVGDASRFFSPEEGRPASDNSYSGYLQEVAGQDGIVEHAGENA